MNKINPPDFWLNIDKPEDFSSAKVVAIVKKITGAKKVGHAGTLDPFATGVLPIAVNKATKTCDYIVGEVKKYYFEIAWGQFRDSDDKTGKVIAESDFIPSSSQIIDALPKFIGTISQVPSSFSAIKINGKKSYELARQGFEIKLKPRLVKIYQIKLISHNSQKTDQNEAACNRSAFEIICSKGTYIRSLAKDLALEIGACGYVFALRRLRVGNFLIKDVISLANLKNIVNYGRPNNFLLPLRDVLNFIPEIELNNFDALKIKNGQFVQLLSDKNKGLIESSSHNILKVKIINEGVLISLASLEFKDGLALLKPINNFN